MLESEARTWAMLAHIVAAAASVMSAGTIAFVAPLIIWLLYKERSALVAHHGKQNLNVQTTTLVLGAGAVVVGLLLLVAGVKAYNGEYYNIPLAIRFIK